MIYEVFHTLEAMRQHRQALSGSVALVPTMGALHEGHLSLVKKAKSLADTVILSIFVNPLQFGPHEDFQKYPRDLESDLRKAAAVGVDCFFAPTTETMYPENFGCYVNPTYPMIERWEGQHRPGHFQGVATVVLKLFNVVRPTYAIFGLKDYQQLLLIRKMTSDLDVPVKVVAAPIVRDSDGLALSSRNSFLSSKDRALALGLYRSIQQAQQAILKENQTDLSLLTEQLHSRIAGEPNVKVDYVAFVDPDTLEPQAQFKNETLLILAVHVGTTRLIDNALISL